jgi:hypothetical protein
MKSVHALVAMMAAAVSCAAPAADLSRNYVEAGVARLSEDLPAAIGGDARFDGGYLRGSVALGTTGLYGFGSHRQGSGDAMFDGLDQSRSQIGVGYAYRVTPRAELLGEAGYLRDEIEGFDLDTARVSAGARGQLGTRFEAWTKLHYTENTFDSSRYAGEVGGMMKFGETWGVTGEVELGERRSELRLGMRASF